MDLGWGVEHRRSNAVPFDGGFRGFRGAYGFEFRVGVFGLRVFNCACSVSVRCCLVLEPEDRFSNPKALRLMSDTRSPNF